MAGKTQLKDMTGLKFGHLTVVRRNGYYKATSQAAWLCRCKCGRDIVVCGASLRGGRSSKCKRCCGPRLSHGRAKTALYAVWSSMKSRCSNPKNHAYERY